MAVISAAFPGMAQFANGDNGKGGVIVGVSLILMIAFFFQLAEAGDPFIKALQQERNPYTDEKVIRSLTPIVWILGVGLVVWVYAFVDALVVAKRQRSAASKKDRDR